MDIKTKIRNISMIVGIATTAFVGLFFILFVDLYLKGDSIELFIGIILPLASIVATVLAESFKHKPAVFYTLKIVAVLLVAGFIVYAIYFKGTGRFTDTLTSLKYFRKYDGRTVFVWNKNFTDGTEIRFDKLPAYIVMLVIAGIGTVAQAINAVANKLVGLD